MNEAKYFRLKLNEPKTFIKLFEILGKLLDFAEVSISPSSLYLVAMDASHVLNVELTLPGVFFNEYIIHIPKKIRLDLKELNQVLKRSRNEPLFLMDSSYENKLVAQFQSNESKRNFRVKLQDPIDNAEPIRDIDYKATVSMVAEYVAELVGDALLANDYATFMLKSNGSGDCFTINAEGDGDTEFDVEIKNFLEKPAASGKQQSIYSLIYLDDIVKLKDVATKVNLRFSSDMPLELIYPLEHDGKIVLTLAPRATDEEGEAVSDEPQKKRGKPLVIKDDEGDIDLEPEDESEKPEEESEAEQG